MFTVSMILACLPPCGNEIHVFACFTLEKRFSIFISRGLQLNHDHLHTERKSVRDREKVLREMSGIEKNNGIL